MTDNDVTAYALPALIADAISNGLTPEGTVEAARDALVPWWQQEVYPPVQARVAAETGLSARSRTFALRTMTLTVEHVQPHMLQAGLLSAMLATRLAELTGESVTDVIRDALERADHL